MRITVAFIAAVALCLIGAEQAAACSCAGPTKDQTVEEYVRERAKQSDGVVIAKLLRVKKHPGASPFGEATFTYLVKRSFKHLKRLPAGKRIRIDSSLSSASCGLPQREGRRTGMFLERFEGHWASSLCSLIDAGALRAAYRGKGASRLASSARPWCPARGPDRRATGSPARA
jgi:hypothetical protein